MANGGYGKWFGWLCFLAVITLALVGCNSQGCRFGVSDLENPDPTIKIMAIKWAGDNKVSSAVPQLVDSLQNEDESVRFYAIEALRRITGTDHGYDYKAAGHLRAAAVKRWQEFLDPNSLQNDEY